MFFHEFVEKKIKAAKENQDCGCHGVEVDYEQVAEAMKFEPDMWYKFPQTEELRVYSFPGPDGVYEFFVHGVTHFMLSSSGNHRVITEQGITAVIPKGWIGMAAYPAMM